MATPTFTRPTPVLPQQPRPGSKFPVQARASQVLQSSRAPAQLSLFLRPSANDPR